MNIDHIKQVYLIGIGGIGMSGLARYFKHLGCDVAGYDRTETELTKKLVSEGIDVSYIDEAANIGDNYKTANAETLVIYTPAIPANSQIKNFLQEQGHRLYKRSEVLGIISENRFTIGIAGTHGKTTTSTLVAHILKDAGIDCSAFLGGISSNYNTNVLFGKSDIVVVEADEFDRSFLTLHPNIAVVTSSDADHLDIYGTKEQLIESFSLYLSRVVENGLKIVKEGLPFPAQIKYSASEKSTVYAERIRVENGDFYFDYKGQNGEMNNLHLGLAGIHNVENAVAAITVAKALNIEDHKIAAALSNFKGVKRRFEYIVRQEDTVYVDDYAHHPEELRAFILSMRKLYPTKKLTLIFQPHLFTRTRDFITGFAEVLSLADRVLLMEIYPARELPIEGVNSAWLLSKITASEKQLVSPQEILAIVSKERPELLVTVGAGDIDRLVHPLQEILVHA